MAKSAMRCEMIRTARETTIDLFTRGRTIRQEVIATLSRGEAGRRTQTTFKSGPRVITKGKEDTMTAKILVTTRSIATRTILNLKVLVQSVEKRIIKLVSVSVQMKLKIETDPRLTTK